MGFKARSIGAIANQFEAAKAKLEAVKQEHEKLVMDVGKLQAELVQRIGLGRQEPEPKQAAPKAKPKRRGKKKTDTATLREEALKVINKKPQRVGDIAAALAAAGMVVDKRRLAVSGIKPLVDAGDVKQIGDRGQARYVRA